MLEVGDDACAMLVGGEGARLGCAEPTGDGLFAGEE